MSKELIDCKGTELAIGQRVVFNFSGNLASGTIIHIREAWRRDNYFTGYVLIKRDRNYPYAHANTDESKVRNLQGIYVL